MFGSSSFLYDFIRSLLLSRNELAYFDDVLNSSSSFLASLVCSYSMRLLRIFYSFFLPMSLPFLLMRELYRFLTICYVLQPSRSLTIWLHFLPFSWTNFKRIRSCSGAHIPLTLLGSKWFIHLSRHCFDER